MAKARTSPVKMIDFLLAMHIDPPIQLNTLLAADIFSGRPPQSITELTEERYRRLVPRIKSDLR
jgi:hypothetical protein